MQASEGRRGVGLGIGAGIIATVLVTLVAALIAAYSGAYNVAATEDHTALVRWALDTSMHNSVETRAEAIKPPATFDQAAIEAGAAEYKAMCQHCHAGPGVDRAEWAEGLLPQPPHLAEAATEWTPNQVFWLIKHGVKMSAMPAFGPSHDDASLWNIVAFVEQLPAMTAETYAAFEPGHHGAVSSGHSH